MNEKHIWQVAYTHGEPIKAGGRLHTRRYVAYILTDSGSLSSVSAKLETLYGSHEVFSARYLGVAL